MSSDMTLVEQLGIEQPFIQAPLVFYPNQTQLVISVSENGGLGVLGADHLEEKSLKHDLDVIKQSTESSFAVCLNVAQRYTASDLASQSFSNQVLNQAYKALLIDKNVAKTALHFDKAFEVTIRFKPKAIIFKNGLPSNEQLMQCAREKILTIAVVSNLLEAITASHVVDAILLQGIESAGPMSQFNNDLSMPYFPCGTLLFHAVRHVAKPLIVWGDYQYPEQFVSAFINGASAVMTDIPFWCTKESGIPNSYREKLKYHNEMQTRSTYLWTGKRANCIENRFLQETASLEASLKNNQNSSYLRPIIDEAIKQGNVDYMPLWAGLCSYYNKQSVAELMQTLASSVDNMMDEG